MSKIFEQGAFSRYSKRSLENATSPILEHSQFSAKTTVFISHRHDDLEDLQGVLGFLEDEYKVKVYIDSKDSSMPITTSAETAINLKDRIRVCDRFILLEYMRIYPYIEFSDGTEKYSNGQQITRGYYVVTPKDGKNIYCSLKQWLSKGSIY